MRKLLSIPLIVLILFSGLTVNVATHYCCNTLVDTKLTLSGELATCGMETVKTEKTTTERLANHCCDNILSAYSFRNIYIPTFSFVNDPVHHIADVSFFISDNLNPADNFSFIPKEVIRPPGISNQLSAEQEILCIFRI
jgi:hypothetical protein